MIEIDKIWPAPWDRSDWTGEMISIDGCPTKQDLTEDDVAEVVAYYSTPDGWDGANAGIVRLTDGRFVAWEADWGPTGSGFCCDAYGGTADIVFARTAEAARAGLTECGRELLSKGE